MTTSFHYRAGYAAGESDARAFRLDNPSRFRSEEARAGYREGYASCNPIEPRHAFLVAMPWRGELVLSANIKVASQDIHVTLLSPCGADGKLPITGYSGVVRHRLAALWLRRLWLSFSDDFRALAADFVRNEQSSDRVQPVFQDYLDETDHPLADFLRFAYRWPSSWPLYPDRPEMPAGDFVPAQSRFSRMSHWFQLLPDGSWRAACGRCQHATLESNVVQNPSYCPTCYLMKPLPVQEVSP